MTEITLYNMFLIVVCLDMIRLFVWSKADFYDVIAPSFEKPNRTLISLAYAESKIGSGRHYDQK